MHRSTVTWWRDTAAWSVQPVYLESATDEELGRGVPDVEVAGLEEVPAGPHGHHGEGHAVGGAVLEVPVELGDP